MVLNGTAQAVGSLSARPWAVGGSALRVGPAAAELAPDGQSGDGRAHQRADRQATHERPASERMLRDEVRQVVEALERAADERQFVGFEWLGPGVVRLAFARDR